MIPDQQSDQRPGGRLHDALRRASDEFGPHRTDLVLRAASRGRRLRLVRRVQLGAVAAAVAGAAVLGAAQVSYRTAPPLPAVPATPSGTPSATPTTTAAPVPSASRAPSAAPPAGGPRSGSISAQLAAFLPPGTTARVSARGSFTDGRIVDPSDEGGAGGSVVYDDGKGRASVDVHLVDGPRQQPICEKSVSWLFCDTLPGGTVVKAQKVTLASGYLLWSVTATRPDGRRVEVSETHTDRLPGVAPPTTVKPTPTRPEPPLTIDQLQAIALSAHWDR